MTFGNSNYNYYNSYGSNKIITIVATTATTTTTTVAANYQHSYNDCSCNRIIIITRCAFCIVSNTNK